MQRINKVVPVQVRKFCGGVEVYFHTFSTSAVDGDEWRLHVPAALPPGKKPPVPILGETVWAP
jgi:hypothetical protein